LDVTVALLSPSHSQRSLTSRSSCLQARKRHKNIDNGYGMRRRRKRKILYAKHIHFKFPSPLILPAYFVNNDDSKVKVEDNGSPSDYKIGDATQEYIAYASKESNLQLISSSVVSHQQSSVAKMIDNKSSSQLHDSGNASVDIPKSSTVLPALEKTNIETPESSHLHDSGNFSISIHKSSTVPLTPKRKNIETQKIS